MFYINVVTAGISPQFGALRPGWALHGIVEWDFNQRMLISRTSGDNWHLP